ncbi:MAG: cyclic nucleotide-binding domain-containing protein [Candidatus Dormibacteraeota bacterium]|nr:cyclic nucleotide-binding domain-containing protein [Candidatus Dormibacteraeota bacterium]
MSISWIPSEAISGMTKMPFEMGMAHYDQAPPDVIEDLEALRVADRFRFANELKAWIEVEDSKIVDHGYTGKGHIGSTTIGFGPGKMTVAAVSLPDRQQEAKVDGGSVRFVQTAGGRTGVPAPRRVKYPPFIQVAAPLAWTTLELTIHADGTVDHVCSGASPFPRHWIYDQDGKLSGKTGVIDFKEWYTKAFGEHSPWGDEDSPALVTAVESALERELSSHIMKLNTSPKISKVAEGDTLVEEGDPGSELYLLLDGVLAVEVKGEKLVDLGPGVVLGERALLEGGKRTATLRAKTPCKVAVVSGDQVSPELLTELAGGHHREEA